MTISSVSLPIFHAPPDFPAANKEWQVNRHCRRGLDSAGSINQSTIQVESLRHPTAEVGEKALLIATNEHG
jgi:hypothetical protein